MRGHDGVRTTVGRARRRARWLALGAAGALACTAAPLPTATAAPAATAPAPAPASAPASAAGQDAKKPSAVGYGGAVATVDLDASRAGLQVLRRGGNAADAAVAAAAALGVTEPFSAGIGGGGYFVYYDARTRRVSTIDGRETAPAAFTRTTFVDPATGRPYPFADVVTSGLSVGVPGTPRTWQEAVRRFGTRPLAQLLQPSIRLAERGFPVDETFAGQVTANAARFGRFSSTRELFLPGGQAPAVGSVFRNPDLARTYRRLASRGVDSFYSGPLARDVVAAANRPPLAPGAAPVLTGVLTPQDLAGYRTVSRRPTRVSYRGLDVYGMPPSSSGGTTVGESLNILENADLRRSGGTDRSRALHLYLESTRRAFADRNRYVGDPAFTEGVPAFQDAAGRPAWRQLLSQGFADERFCDIDPERASAGPVAPGSADGRYDPSCASLTDPGDTRAASGDTEGVSTTHLTTADRWGNVASYTLTIEQTGGNGIVVPGRGFLLNNELTDFDFVAPNPDLPSPNLPAAGKRPRSSMSPTIVLRDGRPFLALGSPGGATIITTVLQTLLNRVEFGLPLPAAIAAPRASQRNQATGATDAEPAFVASAAGQELQSRFGHRFTANPEIGAATAIEFRGRGLLQAAAETTRRGGGSALVLLEVPAPR